MGPGQPVQAQQEHRAALGRTVGQSRLPKGFDAGRQAARAALDGIDGRAPGLALVLLKRILEWRPDQEVILMSGYARIERVEEARQLGAHTFLSKPLTRRPLAAAIRKGLSGD